MRSATAVVRWRVEEKGTRERSHYRKTLLCRVPAAHGEMVQTHGRTIAVR
jgi:hypothetical protein